LDRTWLLSDVGWGLHFENNNPANLGVDQDHVKPVFVAKFVNDRNTWHGYPADYQKNNQDIPPEQIRKTWLDLKLFGNRTGAIISKLIRMKPCSL